MNKEKLYKDIIGAVSECVKKVLDPEPHLVTEMAKFGEGKWGKRTYIAAVHGASTKDRPNPHIHIYYANEKNFVNPQFNFEISIIDILVKDEINLIYQYDRSNDICNTHRNKCTWDGYKPLLKGFIKFLFSTPSPTRRGGSFIDNLDRAIHEWNRETDLNGYENLGKNPLKEYLDKRNLEVLPTYMKYFIDD